MRNLNYYKVEVLSVNEIESINGGLDLPWWLESLRDYFFGEPER